MNTIALLGAGGKMGLRLSANLQNSRYQVRHVEIGDNGRAALRGRGIEPVDQDQAYAGLLPDNPRLSYFITHPCHPPIFSDQVDPQAQRDFFGGEHAKQHIVCCLMSGPEEHYAEGEEIARTIYKPVMKSHRCTVEQMAILEPVLSETVLGTCLTILREEKEGAVFSDGALKAIERARDVIFKRDWKRVFEREAIAESVEHITRMEAGASR